ncbi:MAG: hypothetical protein E7385_01580 [Ruminococcaceae bacterium]|nr:hypothetical protein [Oscillospiraceae bacterium]
MIQTIIEWFLVIIVISIVVFMSSSLLFNKQAKKLVRKHIKFNLGTEGGFPRFAVISDLHLENILVPWSKIIDIIIDENPEFILIAGDLSSTLAAVPRAHDFIKELAHRTELPIYIIFGNHDNILFDEKKVGKGFLTHEGYAASLESLSPNIKLLHNEIIDLGDIMLAGLEDYRTCKVDIAEITLKWARIASEKNKPLILMTHNPDSVTKMCENADEMQHVAVICGHTHGGQIKTPFNIEYKMIRHDIMPKEGYAYGMHNYKGINVYITSGIGCSCLPMRYKSTAEVVIAEIE